MMIDTTIVWAALCSSLLAILLSLFLLREQKRLKKQLQQLVDAQRAADNSFSGSLSRAEQNQRETLTEKTYQSGTQPYRQIAELMQQGQGAHEIAEVLQLPETEVEQLLALARLKRGTADHGH